MASDADLTFRGTKHDDTIRRLYEALPDFEDADVVQIIAAMVWLDQQAGQDKPDNVIVMAPGYALWLPPFITFVDPEASDVMRQIAEVGTAGGELDSALIERGDVIFARPQPVKFAIPEYTRGHPEYEGIDAYVFPAVISDQVRTIRVLTEAEMEEGRPAIFTTTAAGERIYVQDRSY